MSNADRLRALREKRIDDLLGPLRERFAADLPAQAEAIDALMLAADRAPDPLVPLRWLRAIVHRLSGVATILGHAEVGRLAQRSEALIADLEAGDGATLGSVGDSLDELVLEMERHAAADPGGAGAPRPAHRVGPAAT